MTQQLKKQKQWDYQKQKATVKLIQHWNKFVERMIKVKKIKLWFNFKYMM